MPTAIVWNLQFTLWTPQDKACLCSKQLKLAFPPVPGIFIEDPAWAGLSERRPEHSIRGVGFNTASGEFTVILEDVRTKSQDEFECLAEKYRSVGWEAEPLFTRPSERI